MTQPTVGSRDDLLARLRSQGSVYDDAVSELRVLMLRAARFQVSRMHNIGELPGRAEEIASAAADEATVAALARLGTFAGRSRFTTWAYRFGVLHALVEVRRASWRERPVDLMTLGELAQDNVSLEAHVEAAEFVNAVRKAIDAELTGHQRRIVTALIIDGVPPDVLAERLGSTRNAMYKVTIQVGG